ALQRRCEPESAWADLPKRSQDHSTLGASVAQPRRARIDTGAGRAAGHAQAQPRDPGLCAGALAGLGEVGPLWHRQTAAPGDPAGLRNLSQETLRPLLGELKREQSSAAPPGSSGETTAEGLPQLGQSAPDNQPISSEAREQACDCPVAEALPEAGKPDWALEAAPQTLWCDHLGMLVFAPLLVAVAQVVEPAQARLKQWLASLLLGALNIEQTKFLNWPDV